MSPAPWLADTTAVTADSSEFTADGGLPVAPSPLASGFVRRSGADYADGFAALLPTGPAWPRDAASVLMRAVAGLAGVWGRVDARAADIVEIETDPRATLELLPDWERAWGLPDPCVSEPQGVDERRLILVHRITLLGGQSREFFVGVAAELGYAIEIREYSPFMAGVSRCGDTRDLDEGGRYRWEIAAPESRFYWTVRIAGVRLIWFRASVGESGIDPHLRFSRATDLECVLERWKPAHTEIIFDYSGLLLLDYAKAENSQYLPGLNA